ncbi:unnamed protein product [Linum tenue]|uniref:S-protein homolog n=1 Tax=Linum tenue TaxID=586396 RepID=A0AAV0RGU4_9ROSI|nr:unnamed protein product [Linum tenue]
MAGLQISDARIVNIVNRVSSKKILIVHCQSKDDDLSARAMNYGESYSWSFGDNFWRARVGLFWCRLALEDKRLSFDAFTEQRNGGGYAVTGYDVNETGVYGPDDCNKWRRSETESELLHQWKQIQLH